MVAIFAVNLVLSCALRFLVDIVVVAITRYCQLSIHLLRLVFGIVRRSGGCRFLPLDSQA